MELGSEAHNVKVIALTPEQLGVDQDQMAIQRQYDGLSVQEVMGQGHGRVPAVAGAVAAQGGAGNGAENSRTNTGLAPQPQVPMAQPDANGATAAVASASLASDSGNNENGGEYEVLEKANANLNEEPDKVKAEEVAGPAVNVEEAPTPVKTEDETVIKEFDFEGLFGAAGR